MKSFEELQSGLGPTLALNTAGSTGEHVMLVLPSFSMGESLLSHYAARIPALEHRYLVVMAVLQRIGSCEMIFIGSEEPASEVIDYYLALLPETVRDSVRARFRTVTVPDRSARSVAAKLLEHPEIVATVRGMVGDRPAYIEPWNVTEHEVDAAVALQVPINGSAPALLPLAYKSAGRGLFRAAGVPLPYGHEDVRTVDDVVAAAEDVHRSRPDCTAVVVKHDDSGAGDGNAVIDLRGDVRAAVEALPDWYLRDLLAGGVVEERIGGTEFTSPSAQIDVLPDGRVLLLATHEQELGGADAQVYMGCRFPADAAYVTDLGRHAVAVGEQLARQGAAGRMGIDFAAARDSAGTWRVFALEVNLRKGGTTHPYAVLRNHVPGRYDAGSGRWVAKDGSFRAYRSSDNVLNPAWLGLPPSTVVKAVGERGLHFDHRTGTGVVLHMLSCLAVDGRFGMTAIGRDPAQASELFDATRAAVEASV
ncbi:MAG TPA: peptide ligase PGM1-related protein [Actinomycetes bacterium]